MEQDKCPYGDCGGETKECDASCQSRIRISSDNFRIFVCLKCFKIFSVERAKCSVCGKKKSNRIHYYDEAELFLLESEDEEDKKLLEGKHSFS